MEKERKHKKIYELKQIIKSHSEYLKYIRLTRKQEYDKKYDELRDDAYNKTVKLYSKYELTSKWYGKECLRIEIRYMYIAYGLLRGKSYETIEQPKSENKLSDYNWKIINEVMSKFQEEIVEVISE